MTVTLGDIVSMTGGRVEGPGGASAPTVLGGVSFDSRSVAPGDLFVALPGTRVDGHDFVPAAFAAGASAALVARRVGDTGIEVVVDDPGAALVRLATSLHRRLAAAGTRTVGITGSNGKTTTKDLLAHLLRALYGDPAAVAAPPGSYNNELGLPMTVIRAAMAGVAPRHLVLEMGARGPGHIAELCRIAPPDVGVVLMVGSAHLSEFGSRENIALAKGELAQAIGDGGVCVLNADDPLVWAMRGRTGGRVVGFGTGAGAQVRALDVEEDRHARATFTLHHDGVSAPVSLPLPGLHHVVNALAAAAVALTEGLPVAATAQALSSPTTMSPHRMAVTERADGVTVVDDAYNANPESMAAALRALAVIGEGRRTWAVLGEMRELGEDATEEHDRIGRLAVRLNVDRLLVVGQPARPIHLGAAHEGSWGGESTWLPDAAAAAELLARELAAGDVVLVKASNGVQLWRLAADLSAGAPVGKPS